MRGIGDCENECESECASECDRQSVSASGSSGSCALWVLNEHIAKGVAGGWRDCSVTYTVAIYIHRDVYFVL